MGLSVHAPIRIATERTVVAMPETTIGFFPDVGASFFLPRLDGYVGTYLALTSERLNGVNAYYTGIATHYIDSSSLPGLTARLGELEFKDYNSNDTRLKVINITIEEFSSGIPYNEPMLIAGEIRRAIDRCFQHDHMEQIIKALEDERGKTADWARQTRRTILERCPFSLKLTLKHMRQGRAQNISETFERDYSIASHFMTRPDFASGVSARLIDKPPRAPTWDPQMVEDVRDQNVDSYFRREGQERLGLSGDLSYSVQLGLPGEGEVKKAVVEGMEYSEADAARKIVVAKMMREQRGRPGVKEKVEEILDRKCGVGSRGELVWITETGR